MKQTILKRCQLIYLALSPEECYAELVQIFGEKNALLCAIAVIDTYGEENV